jgi:cell division protein FtsW (lipid II flippase)
VPKSKPTFVNCALACIWLSLGLLAISAALPLLNRSDTDFQQEFVPHMVSLAAFIIGSFLAVKIAYRKNWARWVFSVVNIFGLLALCGFALAFGKEFFDWSLADIIFAAIQYGLGVTASILLFLRESNNWFNKKGASNDL